LTIKPEILAINGLVREAELEYLWELAKQAPKEGVVVELGTFNGRSAAVLCDAVGPERVVTIDSWIMQHHGKNNTDIVEENLSKINPILPDIRTSYTTVLPEDINEVAFLFIDSDHSSFVLQREYRAWNKALIEGAIVAIHDYGVERYGDYTSKIDELFSGAEKIGIIDTLIGFKV
tara:strand:+ start:1464 stop:1991 length:528 start_codon:yes stop_codon:yes gene_type:complete